MENLKFHQAIKQQTSIYMTLSAYQSIVDIPVILTPHSGHIDPPVDFGLKR